MATVHGFVAHADPVQLENEDPVAAVAVSVTLVPCVYVPEQVPVFPVEQLMPDGEVTEPLPLTVVVSANDGSANDAVTDRA